MLAAYPSQIYLHNYANTALTYRVTVYDARTGSSVGTTTIPVGANATVSMPFTEFEQLLKWTPNANQQHANMNFEAVGPTVAPVIGPDTVVLALSTEGATDPAFYEATVGLTVAEVADRRKGP